MKKINIFNKTISPLSDGKGCPVERGGVWELPRRTPCATPSWKEGEHKVPSYRRRPVSGGFNRGGGIPLFSGMTAVIFALFIATPSFATDPDPVAQKTVASKAYVDTKQDIIQTGNILFYDNVGTENDLYVPGLVAYDSTTGSLKGNQIGILDQETIADDEGSLPTYSNAGGHGAEMDNYVPTVRAVAEALQLIWDGMPYWTALTWRSAETTSTNAYETKFVGDTGATAQSWPAIDKDKLVDGSALANALALKQNILPAKSTGNAAPKGKQAVVLDAAGNPSNVYTTAGKDLALTAKSGAQKVMNYIDGTTASATFATSQGLTEAQVKSALVSLELLKDVYSELNAKITNNALPTGTTGTVVTYNGTNATTGVQEFGERAVYDPANTYNASTDATKLATMASVKYECAGYEPAAAGQPAHDGTHPGDEDYCWLWTLPN